MEAAAGRGGPTGRRPQRWDWTAARAELGIDPDVAVHLAALAGQPV